MGLHGIDRLHVAHLCTSSIAEACTISSMIPEKNEKSRNVENNYGGNLCNNHLCLPGNTLLFLWRLLLVLQQCMFYHGFLLPGFTLCNPIRQLDNLKQRLDFLVLLPARATPGINQRRQFFTSPISHLKPFFRFLAHSSHDVLGHLYRYTQVLPGTPR